MMLVKADKDFEAGVPMNAELEAGFTKIVDDDTARGTMVEVGRLLPTSRGVRVRAATGKISVIDGPFAETKEIIGGFAIFELTSKEEVVERCQQLMQLFVDFSEGPSYEGELEIRPIFEPPAFIPTLRLRKRYSTLGVDGNA